MRKSTRMVILVLGMVIAIAYEYRHHQLQRIPGPQPKAPVSAEACRTESTDQEQLP
jgi:hypothetical protein